MYYYLSAENALNQYGKLKVVKQKINENFVMKYARRTAVSSSKGGVLSENDLQMLVSGDAGSNIINQVSSDMKNIYKSNFSLNQNQKKELQYDIIKLNALMNKIKTEKSYIPKMLEEMSIMIDKVTKVVNDNSSMTSAVIQQMKENNKWRSKNSYSTNFKQVIVPNGVYKNLNSTSSAISGLKSIVTSYNKIAAWSENMKQHKSPMTGYRTSNGEHRNFKKGSKTKTEYMDKMIKGFESAIRSFFGFSEEQALDYSLILLQNNNYKYVGQVNETMKKEICEGKNFFSEDKRWTSGLKKTKRMLTVLTNEKWGNPKADFLSNFTQNGVTTSFGIQLKTSFKGFTKGNSSNVNFGGIGTTWDVAIRKAQALYGMSLSGYHGEIINLTTMLMAAIPPENKKFNNVSTSKTHNHSNQEQKNILNQIFAETLRLLAIEAIAGKGNLIDSQIVSVIDGKIFSTLQLANIALSGKNSGLTGTYYNISNNKPNMRYNKIEAYKVQSSNFVPGTPTSKKVEERSKKIYNSYTLLRDTKTNLSVTLYLSKMIKSNNVTIY